MPVRKMWNLFCEINLRKSRVAIFLTQNSILDRMPLAWEATLSAKERKAFKVIYAVARAQEEIYEIMAELLLSSKAPGTITGYVAAIEKWVKFARRNGFGEFPPDRRHLPCHSTIKPVTLTLDASRSLLSSSWPLMEP